MPISSVWSRWKQHGPRAPGGIAEKKSAAESIAEAERLVAIDRPVDAVDELATAWRLDPDPHVEMLLRDLRREAARFVESETGRSSWPPPYGDPFPGLVDEIPEIERDQLCADILGGAVLHHGVVLVRGLFDSDEAAKTLSTLQRTQSAQQSSEADPRWYSPFETGVDQDTSLRNRVARRGGTWLADSPRATAELVTRLADVGVVDAIGSYLGERPAFSLQKSTLRRVEPEEKITGWHQDGSFLEAGVRTMNVWVALSRCGGGHPRSGMEILPRRMDQILEVDRDLGRASISFDLIDNVVAGAQIAHPAFEPGDALMFDERLLHRTALGPGLTEARYALECWFFAPSHTTSTYLPFLA
jgi:hypothetical protein